MSYMLKATEREVAEEWQKYAGFTIRPVPSTIQYYKDLILSFPSHFQFLLYGGTPEIRDIFQRTQKNVVLLDQSKKMIQAMGRLTKAKVSLAENERFVEGNWLENINMSYPVDVAIGDDAINMVDWPNFPVFLQLTAERLASGGIFICHLLVKPSDNLINQSFEEVLRDYHTGEIASQYDLASRLNFLCYDHSTYKMGWQQTINKLGYKQLCQLLPDFDFIRLFQYCNSSFACPPQYLFEEAVLTHFVIEEIFYPHEFDYCLFEPVYVLRKR